MIGVLVLSVVEAYRIQVNVSQQHQEIYRRYVDQEEQVNTLRRNLWQAGNYVRDFFIRTTPEQARILRSQLDTLQAEDALALEHQAHMSPPRPVSAEIRKSLNEFWAVVNPVPVTMLRASNEQQYDFIQREIVPRRGELYSALLDLSAADKQRLQDDDKEFADSRRQGRRAPFANARLERAVVPGGGPVQFAPR